MIKYILLDMDGVLAQFAESANKLFPEPLSEITDWDICNQLGISEDAFWERIEAEGEDFWAKLPDYQWGPQLHATLSTIAPVILSSSPSRCPKCCSGKRRWIIERFGPKYKNYMLGSQKWLLAKPDRVLIDDNENNISAFRKHGGEAILFPQTWNSLAEFARENKQIEYVLQRVKLINERLTRDNYLTTTQCNASSTGEMSSVCRGTCGSAGNSQ